VGNRFSKVIFSPKERETSSSTLFSNQVKKLKEFKKTSEHSKVRLPYGFLFLFFCESPVINQVMVEGGCLWVTICVG
jgi:hypothetical protein